MFRTFLTKFAAKPAPAPAIRRSAPEPAAVPVQPDLPTGEEQDHEPIFQTLAMTDEIREALFPTTPRMVSAIFERPMTAMAPKAPPAYRAHEERGFPLL